MVSLQLRSPARRGLVLLADGFDEQMAICCVRAFRDAGRAIALVGLRSGPVTGKRGVTLHPDMSIDQALEVDAATLVLIPGGRRCAAAIVTDPRAHVLVKATIAGGGRVGVMKTAVESAQELLDVPLSLQGGLTNQEFLTTLLTEEC